MSFFVDLHITEIAILSTLYRFEGCLEVEGWLKTGNKGYSFQAWLFLKLLPTFLVVLLIRDKAKCHLIKVDTMRNILISAAKMTELWLDIVQNLARWPPFFISLLQYVCLWERLYKIWEKSIWYFYHARAADQKVIFVKSPILAWCLSLYDKSAKDKSANDTSAKPTVRMPTVRKGQQCEETRVRMSIVRMPAVRCDIGAKKVRQQCEWQQCENDTAVTCFTAKARVLGSPKPLFSPYETPSLTIT